MISPSIASLHVPRDETRRTLPPHLRHSSAPMASSSFSTAAFATPVPLVNHKCPITFVSRSTPPLPLLPLPRKSRPTAQLSDRTKPVEKTTISTEETFAIDAGRDLFFATMDEQQAIQILDTQFGKLDEIDDRFIAAERLKFFPSEQSAAAIIRFVRNFESSKSDQYILEDIIARRKSVESLGRHKGAFLRPQVVHLLRECLSDDDKYMVEVAVWALGEVGVSDDPQILQDIMAVLQNEDVEKRIVIQTLMQASYQPALAAIEPFMDSPNQTVACSAMTAVAVLSSNPDVMDPVIAVLKSDELNVRRAAIEDITLSKFIPALDSVAVCPNSLVLRSRAVRVLLDAKRQSGQELQNGIDDETARLLDRLIWDHPCDLDLLGMKKETKKARDPDRNIRQLYKNDAIYAYLASRTLAEDHRGDSTEKVAAAVLKSYNDLTYFDYFGAYHVYKTLGWLQYESAYELLLDNVENLPPRFFNHQSGAATALAELGKPEAIPVLHKVASNTAIWELKYACLIASERLGDEGELRRILQQDDDWIIQARATSPLSFDHLRTSFN